MRCLRIYWGALARNVVRNTITVRYEIFNGVQSHEHSWLMPGFYGGGSKFPKGETEHLSFNLSFKPIKTISGRLTTVRLEYFREIFNFYARGSVVVKTLCYKPEGCWFETGWGINPTERGCVIDSYRCRSLRHSWKVTTSYLHHIFVEDFFSVMLPTQGMT
jgi:hypothetical protein